MLSGGTNGLYRSTLATGPQYHTRLEVWRGNVRVDDYGDDGLPFSTGTMSATLTSQVTRRMEFTTLPELYPDAVDDLLAPYGNEVRAYMTVHGGAETPIEFPIFRGRINTVSQPLYTLVQCVDRAGDVGDALFRVPENSRPGVTVGDEIKRLIAAGVIDAEFGTFSPAYAPTPKLTWESDRAAACDELAATVGCYWYALADGSYVMRWIPWTVSGDPIVELFDGEGGTIMAATPARSRQDVFNAITVVAERTDGTEPFYATAYDSTPSSPTFIDGAFGIKARHLLVQGITSQGQAASIARQALRAAQALTEAWTVQMMPDPALELGDVATIRYNGRTVVQVLAGFTLPIDGDGPMESTWRAQVPGSALLEGA